eukprot:3817869-Alexandrium_andersonii.AAC.1
MPTRFPGARAAGVRVRAGQSRQNRQARLSHAGGVLALQDAASGEPEGLLEHEPHRPEDPADLGRWQHDGSGGVPGPLRQADGLARAA